LFKIVEAIRGLGKKYRKAFYRSETFLPSTFFILQLRARITDQKEKEKEKHVKTI